MEGEVTTGRYGRDQALGGLATLVHKSLGQKMRRQSRQGEAQVQLVEVQDWVVGNVYAPPRGTEKLLHLVQHELIRENIGPAQKAIFAGDWNMEEDQGMGAVLATKGLAPSTWSRVVLR